MINPPPASRNEWRAKIGDCIDGLTLIPREHIRTRDLKANFAAYDNALRKARKASLSLWEISIINDAMPSGLTLPLGIGIKQVDEQLAAVERYKERYKGTLWAKDKGAKPLDLDAEAAVQVARDLIEEREIKPTASPKSSWHQLAVLLYESITGTANKSLMFYLRNWKPIDEEIKEEVRRFLRNGA